MFERRLRIVLSVLIILCLVLFGRVFGMQIWRHAYWTKLAAGVLVRPTLTDTTRGRIFDFKNRPLAVDTACTDACVDYRAILDPPDPEWLKKIARDRVTKRAAADGKKLAPDARAAAINAEEKTIRSQLQAMWSTLAALYQPTGAVSDDGTPIDAEKVIEAKRKEIIQMVEARRRAAIAYGREKVEENSSASSALVRWIFKDASSNAAGADAGLVIEDQLEPHVILHALDSEGCNLLGKNLEVFPGLVLRPSTHRLYPEHTTAAHLMGRMAPASAADMARNKTMDQDDPRRYLPSDMVGREGVEALCEPLLRGVRGKIVKQLNDGPGGPEPVIEETPFQPGTDVHLSIDADLQAKVQQMLQHVEIKADGAYVTPPGGVSMHSAAVILDVKTNELRVLASNPGFDVNDLETRYAALIADKVEQPLRNRATSDEFEPGSTVKPLLGLGAITQGIIGPQDTIECTGTLYVPEIGPHGQVRRLQMPGGRCWPLSEHTAAQLKAWGVDGSHHTLPTYAPHPTGFLTFADALERSCDIYFETVADRLGPEGVNHWYDQFGLGRITGVGIYERPGLRSAEWKLPLKTTPRMNNCLNGMGEGTAWATPLQIANEAATIARGGIWMRPRLLTAQTQAALDAVHPRPPGSVPDQANLQLNPEALRQAKIGMRNVVDGPAGTGKIDHPAWLSIAAKTGTADTSPLHIKVTNAEGKVVTVNRPAVLRGQPENDTPWYRSDKGTEVVTWYMGYAPADDPKIAFCVMIEYPGASAGVAAGPVASKILDACVSAGYLHPPGGAVASGN